MDNPRISVICPFYNSERFIAEAIESVLGQSYGDSELLLVDDGSDDRSSTIALQYVKRHPRRIRYLQHDGHTNRGAAASRNLGLGVSKSQFVAFIDSDDVWRPGKLTEQLAVLDEHPDVGMVCGAANYWRSWAGGADQVLPSFGPMDRILRPPATALRLYPLGLAVAPCPSDLLVRRSVVDAIDGFEPQFVGPGNYEDQAFLVKVYFATPVYFSRNVWLDYRLHDDSCMATGVREGRDRDMRRHFLNWLTNYVAEHDIAGKPAVEKAIKRAKWELDHRIVSALLRRGRRLVRTLLPQ